MFDPMNLVDPFEPTPMERFFAAQAKLEAFPKYKKEDKEPDAFEIAMKQRAQERSDQLNSCGLLDRVVMWIVNVLNKFFNKPISLEDTLADIVIVMLESKPEGWRFSGDQAKFDDMHVIMNDFTSPRRVRFQMRTMDHKTFYPDIRPTRSKRKELVLKALEARDHKILQNITSEVKKQVFMITDQREPAKQ